MSGLLGLAYGSDGSDDESAEGGSQPDAAVAVPQPRRQRAALGLAVYSAEDDIDAEADESAVGPGALSVPASRGGPSVAVAAKRKVAFDRAAPRHTDRARKRV